MVDQAWKSLGTVSWSGGDAHESVLAKSALADFKRELPHPWQRIGLVGEVSWDGGRSNRDRREAMEAMLLRFEFQHWDQCPLHLLSLGIISTFKLLERMLSCRTGD